MDNASRLSAIVLCACAILVTCGVLRADETCNLPTL